MLHMIKCTLLHSATAVEQSMESVNLQSEHDKYLYLPAGPAMRNRSHLEETLRLATAEPSAEHSGEEQPGLFTPPVTLWCFPVRSHPHSPESQRP